MAEGSRDKNHRGNGVYHVGLLHDFSRLCEIRKIQHQAGRADDYSKQGDTKPEPRFFAAIEAS